MMTKLKLYIQSILTEVKRQNPFRKLPPKINNTESSNSKLKNSE